MSFSTRFTAKKKKLHTGSFEEYLKACSIEKIEDEYDIALADEAYNECIRNGRKSRPIDELWRELDL